MRLLALTAAHPERALRGADVGRAPRGAAAARSRASPAAGDRGGARALEHLAALVDLYDRGHARAAAARLPDLRRLRQAAHAGGDPVAAGAPRRGSRTWSFDKEDSEPEHQLVLGGVRPFADLLAERRAPTSGRRWDAAEPTRFGRSRARLWDGAAGARGAGDR